MSKNKNNGFQNPAARKFNDVNQVALYDEDEIYSILKKELPTILGQITTAKTGGKYPEYAINMFANVSSAKFILEYVKLWAKQMRKHGESDMFKSYDDIKALRNLIAGGFNNRNKFQEQQMDEKLRNSLLLKAYAIIDPKMVKKAKKLKLKNKRETIELALQMRKDPKFCIERVVKLFDNSSVSKKKKLKALKKMAGNRFVSFIGAAMTVNRAVTDFVGMAYDVIMKGKNGKKPNKKMRKYRKPFLRAYAKMFKKRQFFNAILTDNFYELNKKIIKDLINEDLGFKKAFDVLKSKSRVKAKKPTADVGSLVVAAKKGDDKSKKNDKPPFKPTVTKKRVERNPELTKFLNATKPGGEAAS